MDCGTRPAQRIAHAAPSQRRVREKRPSTFAGSDFPRRARESRPLDTKPKEQCPGTTGALLLWFSTVYCNAALTLPASYKLLQTRLQGTLQGTLTAAAAAPAVGVSCLQR